MADFVVSIDGKSGAELAARLRKFGLSILDLHQSFDETGSYLTRFFSGEVFASRGGVIGEPWQPLNDNYAAYKARTWPGRPPMIRTGLLNRSFKHKSTALSTSLWNEASYFDYHQEGQGVPRRVLMKIDGQREVKVVGFIADGIQREMNNVGI